MLAPLEGSVSQPFWVVLALVSCITPFTMVALPWVVQPSGKAEKLLLKISAFTIGLFVSLAETVKESGLFWVNSVPSTVLNTGTPLTSAVNVCEVVPPELAAFTAKV